ncbi:hypothetical protein [Bacillus atrophaeus]|uniref:hypothetical protein n=1 Tax=Bacillus atrophaeus TaxID=1452 RepID=UPI001C121A48|nr:hypothetical protein [Bacillus atrophaeus]MBU5262071.1 hypothetical protein [Bacillus atrophaeus]
MTEQELIKELRMSLPSNRILEVVRNGAIQVYGDLIFLKKKDEADSSDFIKWEENKGYNYDYRELQGKNVIFGHTLFNERGKEALKAFLEA